MKNKNVIKITSALILSFATLATSTVSLGHPGKTDSRGGHKDNKNKSGLGSYHYHCEYETPHLHHEGLCTYDSVTALSNEVTITKTTTNITPKRIYARVPNFPVKISGTDINTGSAEYPPLLFNDVTYIPLTSDILNYLDVSYKWDDASNLIFNRNSSSGIKQFVHQFINGSSWYGNTVEISRVNKGINANGLWITNKYPIISHKGINYLPLTSDILTNLGLSGGWTPASGFDLNLK